MKNHILILCLIFTGCASNQPEYSPLSDTGKPALHSIQSAQLKVLMQQLDDLMFEHMLNEVQIDRQRRYRTKEIVKVSDNLLKTIDFIPNALPGLSLDKHEQKIFLNLTEKLKNQVSLLKQEAENNHVDVIPKRANKIIETCNACHHIFRQYKTQ